MGKYDGESVGNYKKFTQNPEKSIDGRGNLNIIIYEQMLI